MVDNGDTWWKAPPEFSGLVEQNRAEFKAQFGSFPDALIKRYWLTAPTWPSNSISRMARHTASRCAGNGCQILSSSWPARHTT